MNNNDNTDNTNNTIDYILINTFYFISSLLEPYIFLK